MSESADINILTQILDAFGQTVLDNLRVEKPNDILNITLDRLKQTLTRCKQNAEENLWIAENIIALKTIEAISSNSQENIDNDKKKILKVVIENLLKEIKKSEKKPEKQDLKPKTQLKRPELQPPSFLQPHFRGNSGFQPSSFNSTYKKPPNIASSFQTDSDSSFQTDNYSPFPVPADERLPPQITEQQLMQSPQIPQIPQIQIPNVLSTLPPKTITQKKNTSLIASIAFGVVGIGFIVLGLLTPIGWIGIVPGGIVITGSIIGFIAHFFKENDNQPLARQNFKKSTFATPQVAKTIALSSISPIESNSKIQNIEQKPENETLYPKKSMNISSKISNPNLKLH